MTYDVSLISLGCPKNLIDSEVMLNIIGNNKKYKVIDKLDEANVIIINTCGFIESAKQESINTIIEIGNYKKTGKCKAIIAAGCLTERYNKKLMELLPELDAVIGTGDYKNIDFVMDKVLENKKVILYGNQEKVDIEVLDRVINKKIPSMYVKIAEGCDNKCTYCAIPFIRGRYRSRSVESILEEVSLLARNGIKEIILIAQDTTVYGKDLYGETRLPELLRKISAIEEIEWVRLMYAYPDRFSDELIDVIATEDKVCKYIDIPIQHANDRILKLMGRHITKRRILSLVERLRDRIPDITIRTSLIVGFPGERKSDFQELMDFIKEVEFDRLGVFTYSREEGTYAYNMENQIREEEKIRRQERIMEMQMSISLKKNTEFIGKTLKVLIEKYEDGYYYGRCYRDAPEVDGSVCFKSNKHMDDGEFCNVLINKASEYDLLGEKIK